MAASFRLLLPPDMNIVRKMTSMINQRVRPLLAGGLLAGLLAGILAGLLLLAGCADKDFSGPTPDLPPEISDIAETEGGVTWATNEDCTCVLLYGTSQGVYDHYGYSVFDGATTHGTDVIDVAAGTYYFRVMATDKAGNVAVSPETAFTLVEVPSPDKVILTMVDVGWGDCLFLEFPSGTTVMIDAGSATTYCGANHKPDVDAFLSARGISTPSGISYVVATHDHCDHYGGLPGNILRKYYDTVFLAPELASRSVWSRVASDLAARDIEHYGLAEGQTSENSTFLAWDPSHGVEVKVLSAGAGRLIGEGDASDPINSDSAVLKVTFGLVDFLLTGDAETFVENRMMAAYESDLPCEVLKVAHHGNDDATSSYFLDAVQPRVGLISNSFAENDGVFDQSVINVLRGHEVDYYVTDRVYMNAGRTDEPQHGNVTVTTDGETFVVSSWE
jgi:competence protein ComEC